MAFDPLLQKPVEAYVYEVVVDGTVRYIGKGRRKRYGDHMRTAKAIIAGTYKGRERRRTFYVNLVKAITDGLSIEHRVTVDGLTDEDAFALEVEAIAHCPFGQLWNELPGGEGQTSEFLRKFWAANPELCAKLSVMAKESWAASPDRRAARFAAEDSKAIQSAMMAEKWADPEYRAMQKQARKGRKLKTRKFSEKRSTLASKRWKDPMFRAKAITGMKTAALRGKKPRSKTIPDHRQSSLSL